MEYRQRETEGAPYVLGMAAGVLLIFASVFCGGETAACPVWSFLAAGGGDGAEPRRLYAAASFRKAPGGEGEALCRPVGCGWGVYGAFGLFSDFRLRCFQNGRRNSIPFFRGSRDVRSLSLRGRRADDRLLRAVLQAAARACLVPFENERRFAVEPALGLPVPVVRGRIPEFFHHPAAQSKIKPDEQRGRAVLL